MLPRTVAAHTRYSTDLKGKYSEQLFCVKGITVQALTVHADCWCSWLNYKRGHLLWESRKEIQEIHGNHTQHVQEDYKSRSAPLYLPAVIYPSVMGYIMPFLMHIWELRKQFSKNECYCSSSSVGIERHQCCLELETVVWKAALEKEAAVHWHSPVPQ